MPKIMIPKAARALMQRENNSLDKDKVGSSIKPDSILSDSSHSQDSTSADPQTRKEHKCIRKLKEECHLANIAVSDNVIFRFACFYNFNFDKARPAMLEKFDDPHLHLRMEDQLYEQFQKKVMFPLPGLRTKNMKHEVLYFRPSRHLPTKMDTDLCIRNMTYVFNSMSLTEEQCRNGIAFISDFNHWTFSKNVSIADSHKFSMALQGQVPTKVEKILIVNAPSWFPKLYRHFFKKMLSKSFAKRVHILKHPQQLQDHLMDGCEKYLPVELGYSVDSTEIVEDFVDFKRYTESIHSMRAS
ncbi:unnamed protein product [Cylindrotheca closterium]|uniref:CRAL-TRIO domain-containing protein n=1 Tax=Cylindrotheca closterium TaxID=2856 RepID=A0AAD2G4V3_9STRA|nr:unnamed protein product [Cylindrotheca closterium]